MRDWCAISRAAGVALRGDTARAQSGGSISNAYKLQSADGPVFVKLEPQRLADRLEAEADGLAALAATGAVRVPRVLALGVTSQSLDDDHGSDEPRTAFLLIEWIAQTQSRTAAALLGSQLAMLHRSSAAQFGWHRDNYIGASPQPNALADDWVGFLREKRIAFQFELAARNGYRLDDEGSGRLLENLGVFYSGYRPQPSLLHGDLWGGNWFCDDQGAPVIFDPAVYYGDREADLAMTELFGGFGKEFYAAYAEAWLLDAGYSVRRDLHKLYHVLNHLNLFGSGYLGQAKQLLQRLCAELG